MLVDLLCNCEVLHKAQKILRICVRISDTTQKNSVHGRVDRHETISTSLHYHSKRCAEAKEPNNKAEMEFILGAPLAHMLSRYMVWSWELVAKKEQSLKSAEKMVYQMELPTKMVCQLVCQMEQPKKMVCQFVC